MSASVEQPRGAAGGALRIGLVRRGFSGTGGAETYLRRLGEGLRGEGHTPILITDVPWPELPEGWELQRVGPGRGRMDPELFSLALEELRRSPECDLLFSLERIEQCDVYRAGDGVHGAWLERRRRFEPVWRTWFRRLSKKHRALLRLEAALFSGGAQQIIANSELVKKEIMLRHGTPPNCIQVIYNGVPRWRAEAGARERRRAELGFSADDYVILFAGTGWERKGLRFALESVEALPNAVLLIAGAGRARGMLHRSRARFLGAQSRAQMQLNLQAADVFLLPTIYDPFSNACLEALAAGLPVITTRANGFAEIIEAGADGEVVQEPDDVEALRQALLAWKEPGRREAVRGRNEAKGAQFSMQRNLEQTLAVLRRSHLNSVRNSPEPLPRGQGL